MRPAKSKHLFQLSHKWSERENRKPRPTVSSGLPRPTQRRMLAERASFFIVSNKPDTFTVLPRRSEERANKNKAANNEQMGEYIRYLLATSTGTRGRSTNFPCPTCNERFCWQCCTVVSNFIKAVVRVRHSYIHINAQCL